MKILDEYPAAQMLMDAGIPFAAMELASTPYEAIAASGRIGYPVVMKLSSAELTHKTEYGGVKVGISDDADCKTAWDELMTGAGKAGLDFPGSLRGILVQKMSSGGTEFIIGGKRDPAFGPVVMFGLGGIYTELFGEVSFRLAPFELQEAEKMVRRTKAAALLEGFRGEQPLAGDVLYRALVSVSQCMAENPDIEELDINPFVLDRDGGVALDALITLS